MGIASHASITLWSENLSICSKSRNEQVNTTIFHGNLHTRNQQKKIKNEDLDSRVRVIKEVKKSKLVQENIY